MKAIRIHHYGGSEALVFEETPNPEIGTDQVLVEVFAVSVNHIDVMFASGKLKDRSPLEFPWIPGSDFAGRIDFAGEGVTDFKKGDEVYGKLMSGSYAEYVVADQGSFALMPANLSFAEAATVPHVGLTAWEVVFEHGRIEPGQKVLVTGASGAVGSFAIQFAKLAGAFIYAVDKTANLDYVDSLGADVAIDYTTADFANIAKDVDMVLDFVGGDTARRAFPIMKKGGRLVSTVAGADYSESEKYGVEAAYMGVHPDLSDLTEITELIESGKVRTDVALILPLEEAKSAWDIYGHKAEPEKPFTHGKIVLEVR